MCAFAKAVHKDRPNLIHVLPSSAGRTLETKKFTLFLLAGYQAAGFRLISFSIQSYFICNKNVSKLLTN